MDFWVRTRRGKNFDCEGMCSIELVNIQILIY
jgi:hypothetical protein